MKTFAAICVLLVIGSAECGRERRFALFGGAPPNAVPAPPGVAAPSPLAMKSTALNAALIPLVAELEIEEELGGPVNPAVLLKATVLASKIQLLGGEVDPATRARLGALQADLVQESGFLLDSAKEPAGVHQAPPPPKK